MALLNAEGNLTTLRVVDVGTAFGPPTDRIDVEVIFRLDSQPENAIGFRLRDDGNRPVRQGMLDLLRDAFNRGWVVHTDFEIGEGKKNGIAIRVWLTRPQGRPAQPEMHPIVVGPVIAPRQ
jgi:hypothetical protein